MFTAIYMMVFGTGIACVALLAYGLWLDKTTAVYHGEAGDEVELKKAA